MKSVRTVAIVVASFAPWLSSCQSRGSATVAAVPAVSPKPAPVAASAPALVAPEPRADKECAAPLDVGPNTEVTVAGKKASQAGYRLTFPHQNSSDRLILGVLGPLNEDSGQNILAVKKYLKFFKDEKVDAIVVTGDVGEVADGISRLLRTLADSKVPVLVIAGNRECRADFTDGLTAAKKASDTIVNMNTTRVVDFPMATLVSLPGYHDPNYINCTTGCRYHKSTIDEVGQAAKDSAKPVIVVAHAPPRGSTHMAIDYAINSENAGDEQLTKLMASQKIPFGFFSNIKEAGAHATVDLEGTTQLKENEASPTLYLNPGPADTVGWEMNDGSRSLGIAAVFSLSAGQASYKLLRLKAPSSAEKAEAKKLEPPPRSQRTGADEAPQQGAPGAQ